ncbi:MAG: tRNA (adenosine(37)-N6)-threonylcarbamoyltransferase complex dimerization subunit type 1 TsaB [Clostridia bacterium]|nr:tRNA (adenosine(37)-N6)-threonylcarbamoyltransferase complex dimerization subunit type 1 TsaB [Clostridia bacterium]
MTDFLAIDTSSRHLTVYAQKGERSVLRHLPDCAMQHSVVLMDEIDKALKEINLTPKECDFFAAVVGPGSFTGIRIGIATAKGFALAANKPLKSLTAFELIAYNVNSKKSFVVIDAAHAHYYVCGYEDGKVIFNPSYLSQEEVAALPAPLFGFEDLPFENYTKLEIKNCLMNASLKCENLSDDMHALYVRKSQAEEALCENKKVGI